MQICPTCGEPNSDGELFCYLCGQPLENNEKQINNDNIVVKIKPSQDEVDKANQDAMQQMLSQMMDLAGQNMNSTDENYSEDEQGYSEDYNEESDDIQIMDDENDNTEYADDTEYNEDDTEYNDSIDDTEYTDADNNYEENSGFDEQYQDNSFDMTQQQIQQPVKSGKGKTIIIIGTVAIIVSTLLLIIASIVGTSMILRQSTAPSEPLEIENEVVETDETPVDTGDTLDSIISEEPELATTEETSTEVEEDVTVEEKEEEVEREVVEPDSKVVTSEQDSEQEFIDFKNSVYNLLTEQVESEEQIEQFRNSDTEYGYLVIDKDTNKYYCIIFYEDSLKSTEISAKDITYEEFMNLVIENMEQTN